MKFKRKTNETQAVAHAVGAQTKNVTGVLGVGQICIGSTRWLDKTVSEVLGGWTELSETTWIPFV